MKKKDTIEQKTKKEEIEIKETRVERNAPKKRSIVSKMIILLLFIAILYIYARYVGTMGLRVREYSIVNDKVPASFDGFSIVQFSDLELGSTYEVEDLEKLVAKINDLKPDVVVFTGDIVSPGHSLGDEEKNILFDAFTNLDPLIGKYAIKGDDDQYDGLYDELMRESGFMDLSNKYELIYYKGLVPIVIYGLDSLNAGAQNFESTFSYPPLDEDTEYMASFRILLAHEPDTATKIRDYNISLMLSGHSHNSEIDIPFLRDYYNIDGAATYYSEYYNVEGTELYISSGLGTSKFKMRLFNHPSISVFKLYTN